MSVEGEATQNPARIRIWDVPVRLFHWSLVVLLAFSWRTAETHEMEWHLLSGYCILAVLIFRIYWGFFGTSTARFSQFIRGPRATLAYLRSAGQTGEKAPGHNPIGAWSVVALLSILFAMVATGLFSVDIDGLVSGPLADFIDFDTGREAAELHGTIFNIILALAGLHILAILIYVVRGQNLIGPMITGQRRRRFDDEKSVERLSVRMAVPGLCLAIFVSYAIAHSFWMF